MTSFHFFFFGFLAGVVALAACQWFVQYWLGVKL